MVQSVVSFKMTKTNFSLASVTPTGANQRRKAFQREGGRAGGSGDSGAEGWVGDRGSSVGAHLFLG